ncbi:hypothetical protein UCDDS831_g05496 [Diplodia seriata]|uniref:Uncharacterized protein n=1 Tax=Diplodia seriata TaxID=420778 RepID=A0A0G2EAE6_9PEZI|nr:hypothetical protein UCDDS831_g05496 [Diplodia seriata]
MAKQRADSATIRSIKQQSNFFTHFVEDIFNSLHLNQIFDHVLQHFIEILVHSVSRIINVLGLRIVIVYPELAYLYDPPVPGSDGNGSRGALTPVQPPGGGHNPVGPFVVGNPGASSRDGVGGATADGGGTLGATMRGGGGSGTSSGEYDDDQYQRSTSPEGRSAGSRSSSVGSVVSGQQRRLSNPKLQRVSSGKQQQWWQQFPQTSPTATSPTSPSGRFPPPAATHASSNYNPIYPPISPTYPRSGPILTSQHIEANRLQQAQHARATAAATSQAPTVTAYPTFHRPGPNYPPPSNWPQATPTNYSYTHGNAAAMAAAAANARGRPFFHQNTSYNPPHRATIDNYSSLAGSSNNAYSAASPPIVVNPPAPRRGSSGSIHTAIGGVYTTIPEEEGPAPHPQQQRPQQQQQQRQRKQSLTSIMRQMNALDEEDSDQGDEGQGFLQAPRRVLSVRNGAVTPSTDGEEEDARDGGARRHGHGHGHGHGAGRTLL